MCAAPAKRRYETKAQKRAREGLEAWNRSCPTYAEQMFWREVEKAEGVMFMGGDDAFGDGQRNALAQKCLDRDGRWWTIMPMSAREAWRAEYMRQKEQTE